MKVIKVLFVVLLISFTQKVLASHGAGGYFEYTCLGNNQYQVDYYFLRDCSGQPSPNSVQFFLRNSCTTPNCWPNDGFTATKISTEEVNYGCGNECSDMPNNPDFPSLHRVKYSATVTLPYACADWEISVSISARNTVDYCEVGGANGNYFNYCKINNTNGICNSSVKLTGFPYAIGCSNESGTSLYEIVNPDGSVLQYNFVYPQSGECNANANMNFIGSTNANMPFPSNSNFILTNGEFTFEPNVIGTSYFAVRVVEFNANNVYLGETVVDGMIYVSNECSPGNTIDFSDWFFDDDNELHVNGDGELCGETHLTPNDADDQITDVVIEDLPSYMSYTVEFNADGTANVIVCGTFPEEYSCQDLDIPVTIKANTSSASCMNFVTGTGYEGHYHFVKDRSPFCPDNLYFTNKNSTSGNVMPLTARADERIWVGDDMPPAYNVNVSGPEGPVVIPDGGYYTAGIEIILPSCASGGNDCITLLGAIDLEINPGNCNSDCFREPLSIDVREIFKCSNEQLQVNASGEAPFTYELHILGQTIIQESSIFFVHDLISEQDNGQVPYTINIYDAVGDSGSFSGFILGTKRFYEPILDNKFYSIYADNNPSGPTGWYYGANLGVYSDTPAYFTDSVNTTPPWYGATDMWLIVWDRYGHPAVSIRHDLQLQPDGSGGDDWSLNQGEFYWTGKFFNGIWADCFENNETMFFNYTLKARNCYDDQNMDFFVQGMDEASTVVLFSCTDDDPWHPVETKSAHIGDDNNDYAESQVLTGISRIPEIKPEYFTEIFVSPNPAHDEFTIISEFPELYDFILTDQSGKVALKKDIIKQDEKIDVSSLKSGIYTITVTTPDSVKQFKLILL